MRLGILNPLDQDRIVSQSIVNFDFCCPLAIQWAGFVAMSHAQFAIL
jgi:hypothetical protein